MNPQIEVEGLRELKLLLRKVESKDINKGMRDAHKAGAAVIAEEAKTIVPVRSGKLKRSIGAKGSQSSGAIKAGSAARVPYAGVIHYGWRDKNIKAQPFLSEAVGEKLPEAIDIFEDAMAEVMRVIETTRFR
jgi:HK97 gp10 family phage protein